MHNPTSARPYLPRLVARLQLLAGRFPSEAFFVRAAFRTLLDREPDGAALDHYRRLLEQGAATRADVYNAILGSDERHRRRLAAVSSATETPALDLLFRMRIALVEARLARARKDLSADARYLHAAYLVLLRRPPDETGLRTFVTGLATGAFSRAAVFALLRRSPECPAQQGLRLYPALQARLFLGVAALYLRSSGWRLWPLDHRRVLQAAYAGLLGRAVDDSGVAMYLDPLARGKLSPLDVLISVGDSPEFKRRFRLPIRPLDALHQARMILIQSRLPPAEVIVDLGGAAHNEPRGALLMMGYPHRPREITILDLPPEARIGGAEVAEAAQHLVTEEGITVRYLYRSMADLAPIPACSVDLVVSGESIEHISEAEAEQVCDHAFRILRPGGSFCLDTPNARLTRLQSPDELIHPEHQKEYDPDEIRAMLERRGFVIVDGAAICPMPASLRSGVFSYAELTSADALSPNPDEGYMFFFRALKP